MKIKHTWTWQMQIIHQHLNFVIVCTFHFQRQNSCINHSSQNVYGLLFCSIKSSGFNEESLEIMLNWWETWALSLTSWILRYPKILKRISFGNGQDLWKPGKHVNSVFRTDFTTVVTGFFCFLSRIWKSLRNSSSNGFPKWLLLSIEMLFTAESYFAHFVASNWQTYEAFFSFSGKKDEMNLIEWSWMSPQIMNYQGKEEPSLNFSFSRHIIS